MIMRFLNIFGINHEEEEAAMTATTNEAATEVIEKPKCEGRCHDKVNLCNDSNYLFGRNECVEHPFIPLKTAGNTHLGYAVNEGKATHLKVVWKGKASEVLLLERNGEPVEWLHIDGTDVSPKCFRLKERFCDCDVINIREVPAGIRAKGDEEDEEKCGEFIPACEISVVVEYEQDCDARLRKEGDGVLEAIDTTGTTDVNTGSAWFTRKLDSVRNNTLPTKMNFNGSESSVVLKPGIYKVWYESGIKFDQSVSLEYSVKLQENINGAGWTDIPQSGSADFVLAGDKGNVTAGRMITYKVNHGETVHIRIQEMISKDTSIETGSAGAAIVVERVVDGAAVRQ